jgi:hypothetical protein
MFSVFYDGRAQIDNLFIQTRPSIVLGAQCCILGLGFVVRGLPPIAEMLAHLGLGRVGILALDVRTLGFGKEEKGLARTLWCVRVDWRFCLFCLRLRRYAGWCRLAQWG